VSSHDLTLAVITAAATVPDLDDEDGWAEADRLRLLHPSDMARLRVTAGDLLQVTSRRGSIVLPAQPGDAMAPTQAHIAMHWGSEALGGAAASGRPLAGVNAPTTGAFCALSKQSELKHCAVKLIKAELPWRLLALAWLPAERAHMARVALRELMPSFAYAACVPFGSEPDALGRLGVAWRAAAHEAAPAAVMARIESLLGLDDPLALRYVDARRGPRRTIALRTDGKETQRVDAFLIAGHTEAEPWLRALLVDGQPAQTYGRALWRAGATPPAALPARSPQVCTCHDVSEARILKALSVIDGAPGARLATLQQQLRCGTSCGSCLPALRGLASEAPTAATPAQARQGAEYSGAPPAGCSAAKDRLQVDLLGRRLELHAALDVVQVFEHQALGARGIAFGDCIDDLRVFVGAATRRRGCVVQKDHEARQHRQLAHAARQRGVARQLSRQRMELARQADHRALVVTSAGIDFELLVPPQARELFRRQRLDQAAQHGRLDQSSGLEDVERLLDGGLGHVGATLRVQLDDLLVRQACEHLADARTADAEDVGQPLLDQLGARVQPVFKDRHIDLLVDLVVGVFALQASRRGTGARGSGRHGGVQGGE